MKLHMWLFMTWKKVLINCGSVVKLMFPGLPHLQPRLRQWWCCRPHGQVQLRLRRRNPVRPTNSYLQLPWGCLPLWGVSCSIWCCGVWKNSWRLLKTSWNKSITKLPICNMTPRRVCRKWAWLASDSVRLRQGTSVALKETGVCVRVNWRKQTASVSAISKWTSTV